MLKIPKTAMPNKLIKCITKFWIHLNAYFSDYHPLKIWKYQSIRSKLDLKSKFWLSVNEWSIPRLKMVNISSQRNRYNKIAKTWTRIKELISILLIKIWHRLAKLDTSFMSTIYTCPLSSMTEALWLSKLSLNPAMILSKHSSTK